MTSIAKQAIAKVAAVKAKVAKTAEVTKPRGLVSLFPGFASLDFRKSDSLFPGFLELATWILKSQAATARDMLRAGRKERRAIRRTARSERRAARHIADESSIFNFGMLRCKASKNGASYRVTFRIVSA